MFLTKYETFFLNDMTIQCMFLCLKDLFSKIVLILDSWRTRIIFRSVISDWKFSFS